MKDTMLYKTLKERITEIIRLFEDKQYRKNVTLSDMGSKLYPVVNKSIDECVLKVFPYDTVKNELFNTSNKILEKLKFDPPVTEKELSYAASFFAKQLASALVGASMKHICEVIRDYVYPLLVEVSHDIDLSRVIDPEMAIMFAAPDASYDISMRFFELFGLDPIEMIRLRTRCYKEGCSINCAINIVTVIKNKFLIKEAKE